MAYKVEGSTIQNLVIVRHGDYSADGSLNESGRQDIAKLTQQLENYLSRKVLTSGEAIITYSLADRARQSAEIMASRVGLLAIPKSSLGDADGMDYFGQEKRIAEEFGNIASSYSCLIAITHEPITAYLAEILLPEVNGDQNRIVNNAWARVYDRDRMVVATISPDQIISKRDIN